MGNLNDQTVDLSQEISVVVRLLPQGDEVDVDLPLAANGKEIIDSLLGAPDLGIPKMDPEGNRYTYKLTCKETGRQIGEGSSLVEAGVKDGFTLLLMPQLVAGK